ncbi:MAG: glycosyltransferase family 61 protein [Akkermansiaceae bacterium]
MASLRTTAFRVVKLSDQLLKHVPSIGSFRPLRGSFSACQQLRADRRTGDILFENQSTGPCPPDSITARCGMRQHDHQPWPVFWARTDEARLVGQMLHWRDPLNRLCSEGVFHLHERRRLGEDRLFAQILVPKPKLLPGAWTSIASNWGNGGNYFHWITDCLTRLLVREYLPEPTRVLIPKSGAPFVRDSLDLLGLSADCEIREESCLQPERFYFCSPTAMTGVWNPLGFDWLRKRFQPHFRPPGSGRPVFLTRRASTRVPEVLPEIERLFSSAGFDILDCGKLTMLEQIQAASGASAITGLHGAAMTNILWAAPRIPVLELFEPAYLNACYEQIAFQGKLDYSALVLEGDHPLEKINAWLKR